MMIRKLGVVGAGVIGASLAHAALVAGVDVILHDVSDDVLETARRAVRTTHRMLLLRRPNGAGNARAQGALTTTTRLADLTPADLVVENIVESVAAKEQLHDELDEVLPPETVVAVNTSAVPITRLALRGKNPGRVAGAHFMNPVALTDGVEVVRSPYTADTALETLLGFIGQLGKQTVVVDDSAGFVINRCLMIMINEAADLLDDVGAKPADVDQLFRSCLGHRSGPLQTADLIGIDTVVRTLDVLASYYGPARFTPSPRLRRMVDSRALGRKSGAGFYDYSLTQN